MRIFLNILWWIPFCGFVLALANAILGVLWCLTIIGIPIGLGKFQIAKFQLAPHTRALVSRSDIIEARNENDSIIIQIYYGILCVLYFPFGVINLIVVVACILANCLTLLGIPNAVALAKTLFAELNPIDKVCVPRMVKEEIERREAENYLG